ncbi:MAG: hypothetical protein ABI444_13960 [Candidatus Kapaibacterium sp.]|jgi:hypothetical protein
MKTRKAIALAPILIGILAVQFAPAKANANPNEKTGKKHATKYIDYLASRDSVIMHELFPDGVPTDDDWFWYQEQRYLLVKDAQVLGWLNPTCYECSLWYRADA